MESNLESEKKMAKFETDLLNIKDLLLDIKGELKGLNQTYVPRNEIMEMFRARDEQIRDLREEQHRKHTNLPFWWTNIIAVVSLLYSYFKH